MEVAIEHKFVPSQLLLGRVLEDAFRWERWMALQIGTTLLFGTGTGSDNDGNLLPGLSSCGW